MLKWALIFFLISVVAGALGFTSVASGTRTIARVFFAIFVFLLLGVLLMMLLGVSLISP